MTQEARNDGIEALVREHIEILSSRYASALEACNLEAVIVLAGSLRYRTRDDQPDVFHPDPYFAQWLPLTDAHDACIEFVPGRAPRLLQVCDADFWLEPPSRLGEPWARHFEIEMRSREEIGKRLARARPATAIIGESALAPPARQHNEPKLLARLDYDRAIKTRYEHACMAEASSVAARGHLAVAAAFAEGATEFDMHLHYARATRCADAELPYPTIIGVNEHAATLHYQNRRTSAPPELRSMLIDGGASVRGYAADITRTYASERGPFAELIESMERLQQTVCAETRAGIDYVELNERAHALLAHVLEDHDIIACGADEAYETGLTTTFLPHGLGHLLGIQVHDVGGHQADPSGSSRPPPARHPYLRLTRRLEPGFVVTIESGIYFIPQLLEGLRGRARTAVNWLRVEALTPFGGIRIEDNVLVESAGVRNLTREAFSAFARD
jgi:Xaa-Pro dipeptidase